MFETPRITILEYELIINKKLFDQGVITEQIGCWKSSGHSHQTFLQVIDLNGESVNIYL